jgi:hypothetical protein
LQRKLTSRFVRVASGQSFEKIIAEDLFQKSPKNFASD